MSKATPGPYFIREREGGNIVTGTLGIQVAWFGRGCIAGEGERYSIDQRETEANARAFVDGMALTAKIPRLRTAYEATNGLRTTSRQWAEFYDALHDVIDEAKP